MQEDKNQERLNEKDLECIARFYQSVIFEDDMLFGCRYCRFMHECLLDRDGRLKPVLHLDIIRKKLERITGLDLGCMYNPGNPESKFAVYQNLVHWLLLLTDIHLMSHIHQSNSNPVCRVWQILKDYQ